MYNFIPEFQTYARYFLSNIVYLSIFVYLNMPAIAQTNTIGLIQSDERAYPGYTLLAPMPSKITYLIDNQGRIVHKWEGKYRPGHAVYLNENGNLIRTGIRDPGRPGSGGYIEEVEWDGNIVWSVTDEAGGYEFHHDIKDLPNGNLLVIAWEKKSKQEAIEAGRDPRFFTAEFFKPDAILEYKPNIQGSADIVWEWHFWDHMSTDREGSWVANGNPVSSDIKDPGKLNINFIKNGQPDWLHCNSIDYNTELDQIVIIGHNTSEFYVISHSTANYGDPSVGINAARGPEGDFIYRWGNSAAYGMGSAGDKKLFGPHDIQWIMDGLPGAGHFLIYNNGLLRPEGPYSTVEEIVPPILPDKKYHYEPEHAYAPDTPLWMYKAPNPLDFYSPNISGAQRLPNGNTLICAGSSGTLFEVTPAGEIVWKYINPVNDNGPQVQGTVIKNNMVFKCRRYSEDYPGLQGKELIPGDPIELYNTSVTNPFPVAGSFDLTSYPNPSSYQTTIQLTLNTREHVILSVHDILGRHIHTVTDVTLDSGTYHYPLQTQNYSNGMYFIRLITKGGIMTESLQVVRE